jgi:hypothetical protein
MSLWAKDDLTRSDTVAGSGRQGKRAGSHGRPKRPRRSRGESPWVSWRLGGVESRGLSGLALLMVEGLKLRRWQVADGAVQTVVVPPIDPRRRCQLDMFQRAPGAVFADDLGLVQAVDRLGQRVVVAVAA